MIVLKRVRSRRGRTASPSTGRKAPFRRRYYRRNPEVAGTPVGDVLAVIGGGWATHQLASFASGFAAPLTSILDRFKAGLGQAGLSALAAIGVGVGVRRFGKSHYGNMAQLGGLVIAGTQAGSAFTGANLLAGQPSISGGGLKLIQGGKKDEAAAPSRTDTTTGHQVFRDYVRPVAEDMDVGL